MTFTFALLVLTALAIIATVRTVRDGGHGHAPLSHEQDNRFLPPASLLH
jgi:hypothetical protein